jgi:hypothetical protein
MPLTLADIQGHFRRFGKLIYISRVPDGWATSLKRGCVALVDQTATFDVDPLEEFDALTSVISPITAQARSLDVGITAFVKKARAGVGAYLQQFVAVDLGLQAGAADSLIGPALVTAMNAVGATVATLAGNPTGVAAYFSDNFGITLPQSDSPNIPDSWIAETVV